MLFKIGSSLNNSSIKTGLLFLPNKHTCKNTPDGGAIVLLTGCKQFEPEIID
jgi:hypothetical protein